MSFTETLGMGAVDATIPEGLVKITVRHIPTGTEKVHYAELNLITNVGKLSILNALVGGAAAADAIATLRMGTGGCIDPQGRVPKEELVSQTGLTTQVLSVPITYTVDTGNVKATILADINDTTGNGYNLNEVGLFTSSGKMFNVKNFPSIAKTSEFSIHVEWVIRVL